jgi:hypothetical protein
MIYMRSVEDRAFWCGRYLVPCHVLGHTDMAAWLLGFAVAVRT